MVYKVADPGFPGGAKPKGVVPICYAANKLLKTAWNWNKLDWTETGGITNAPLDLPLLETSPFYEQQNNVKC